MVVSMSHDRIREGWGYCGEVWTNVNCRAVVVLPSFVRAHRGGFDYEVMAIGTDCTAYVAEKIRGDRFTIATSQPHVKVAWRLTPLRGVVV